MKLFQSSFCAGVSLTRGAIIPAKVVLVFGFIFPEVLAERMIFWMDLKFLRASFNTASSLLAFIADNAKSALAADDFELALVAAFVELAFAADDVELALVANNAELALVAAFDELAFAASDVEGAFDEGGFTGLDSKWFIFACE